jgi:hypothetical protein
MTQNSKASDSEDSEDSGIGPTCLPVADREPPPDSCLHPHNTRHRKVASLGGPEMQAEPANSRPERRRAVLATPSQHSQTYQATLDNSAPLGDEYLPRRGRSTTESETREGSRKSRASSGRSKRPATDVNLENRPDRIQAKPSRELHPDIAHHHPPSQSEEEDDDVDAESEIENHNSERMEESERQRIGGDE